MNLSFSLDSSINTLSSFIKSSKFSHHSKNGGKFFPPTVVQRAFCPNQNCNALQLYPMFIIPQIYSFFNKFLRFLYYSFPIYFLNSYTFYKQFYSSASATFIITAHSILFLKSSQPYSYTPCMLPVA